jgi:hypothetical protein
MLDVWKGIEPAVAEARLRGLRRRLSELDEALNEQQALARSLPNSFAVKLSGEGLRSMEGALRGELAEVLQYRQAERISIALDGPNFAGHSAKLSDLGVIFTRFQKLFSSVAQSIKTGPTNRGPIPLEILSGTSLRLQASFPSSFGMDIIVPTEFDLLGESLASSALTQLFQLLNVASDSERVMQLSGEIGRRSLVHLRQLSKHLSATDSTLVLDWKDFAGTRYDWKIEKHHAHRIIESIDGIVETSSITKSVEGWLVGASLLKNRFEIIQYNGSVTEGKFVVGLHAEVAKMFGYEVLGTVDETVVSDRATGESRVFHTLKAISKKEPA